MKRLHLFLWVALLSAVVGILPGCRANTDNTPLAVDVNVQVKEGERTQQDFTAAQRQVFESSNDLAYLGWDVDNGSDLPRVCFSFYTPLKASDNVKLRDYFRISPSVNVSTDIEGNDLCLAGFEFDRDYEVTLLEGLPDASGKTLPRDFTENVGFGDKPPFVAFAGDGIILPRIKSQGLAIETINVDVVDVEIARVSDRMVARRDPQSGKSTLEGEYSWEYNDAATNIRDVIWSGKVDVKTDRNQKVTTVIPIAELAGDLPAGAYILTIEREAADDEDRIARAWRWIISTDLALTSYMGEGGLNVSVRSIDSAKLQSGIETTLVAVNNDVLATAKTDGTGHVSFAAPLLRGEGPKAPKMVMAYGDNNDYAVLDLTRSPLDLSEYDVGGRTVKSAVDVYGFTERGVYRPGETAHMTVMIRDVAAKAVTDRPVTLKARRPNGIVMTSRTFQPKDIAGSDGGLVWSYELPADAPRGMWSVGVDVEGIGETGQIEFSVEDFVPQKLSLSIDVDKTPLRADDIRDVNLDAQFLYGAPGAALEGEAEARLRLDPKPFKGFEAYRFGPAEQLYSERFIEIGAGLTDAKGLLTLGLDLKGERISSPWPIRAEITAGVSEPGGRYVRDSVFVPVRSEDVYIGIKPLFEGRRAPLGKPVELSLIALNHLGKQIDSDVTWTLVEEDYDYHWYRENGRWRYRRSVRDIPMTTGDIALESTKPVTWSEQLSWGDYRLDMETEDGAKAGYQFSIGWGKAETSDAPDQLRIGASNGPFAAGDLVKLAVNAPYSGEGELVIANDKVRLIKPITLTEGGSELSFNFAPEWGDSVYALVTLYTPRDITDRPVPRRAVGISHVALDRSGQTLDIEIETKDVLRPRQDQSFTVNVDSAPRGEKVWMSFAAVDEGILQITKYSSPDAPDFYFGKKALAVDIRDDYGRILNANLGDPAIARTGGDSLGGEGLTVVPTRTVSLFSGPVRVKNGKAEVKFAVPDFNGELRLMASAWTESAVGSASSSVKVRDKVPAIVGLPRFLAPGDTAVATISLDNVEGAPGMYSAKFGSSDVVEAKGYLSVNLEEGQRLDNQVQMVSSETGTDELSLSITGPDNYEVGSTYPIQVRTPYMPVTKSETRLVEPGTSFDLSPDIISGFIPSGTDVTVSFSRLPGLDPAPYVDSLARYPYGCTEQTVSTAMPLLYADDLGGIPGQSENQRRRGLQKAISRLSSRQSLDGAFGLWRSGDQNASPWLGVYATDFMHRAKAEGLNVPPDVLTRAYKAVAEISRMPRYPNLQYDFPRNDNWGEKQRAEAAAYAHFVLAKAGKGNLGQMRYVFDNHRNKIKSPLARAYLGSALSLMGDKARANEAFMQAAKDIGYDDTRDYYQSSIRDVAGVIAASADAGQGNIATGLSKSFRDLILDENWLNTQEKSYVILALKSLMASMEPPKVSAKGVTISGKEKRPAASLLGTDLAKTLSFTSKDKTQFWATITVSGSPDSAPAPMAEGFALTKDLFDLSGKAVAAKDVKQGERVIVRLGFRSTANRDRTIVVADLLPAGFEIEAILTSDDGAQRNGGDGAYKWLGKISNFDVTEARDDRFIASHETSRRESYVAAYIARAVTLGDFVMPGAVIEDMYRPEDRAITESSRIKIIANPAL